MVAQSTLRFNLLLTLPNAALEVLTMCAALDGTTEISDEAKALDGATKISNGAEEVTDIEAD